MLNSLYVKRRINGPKLRKLIPCGYCFEEWATCYDHIKPVCHGGTNKKSNLYPACSRCNGLVCGNLFASLDEKRDYIRAKLKERAEWHSADQMRRMREKLPTSPETSNLLFRNVPMERVERKKPTPKTDAKCPVCGCRYCRGKMKIPLCSKKCLEVLCFNKLMDRYLKAVHTALEFRT